MRAHLELSKVGYLLQNSVVRQYPGHTRSLATRYKKAETRSLVILIKAKQGRKTDHQSPK